MDGSAVLSTLSFRLESLKKLSGTAPVIPIFPLIFTFSEAMPESAEPEPRILEQEMKKKQENNIDIIFNNDFFILLSPYC